MNHHESVDASSAESRDGSRSWMALLGWVALAATAGAVGGFASRDAGVFYAALAKPVWAPPGWLFGPVWSALYLLMGVAAWLVWRAQPATPADRASRRLGLALFVGQLGLNALWTWLFFAWRQGALAFVEIALLWLAVAITTWHFGRVRPLAAWCLVPYLGWVSFAAALTWAVWQRNPGLL
ncbi:MAG TPA: TspO/MBR family protein [Gemmatimonadaceae bacterium]|nr:TspO/MBR family protein [Gemmatimonadaceae bacterium]